MSLGKVVDEHTWGKGILESRNFFVKINRIGVV